MAPYWQTEESNNQVLSNFLYKNQRPVPNLPGLMERMNFSSRSWWDLSTLVQFTLPGGHGRPGVCSDSTPPQEEAVLLPARLSSSLRVKASPRKVVSTFKKIRCDGEGCPTTLFLYVLCKNYAINKYICNFPN